MEEYKVGQKIYKIEINKFQTERSKWSSKQNGVKVENLEILGVSEYRVVLNDNWFTTLDIDKREGYKKDRSIYSYIDEINVSMLGDGVFVYLYSTKEPNKELLEKMVAKAAQKIKKEYGFLFNGVIDELYDLVEGL